VSALPEDEVDRARGSDPLLLEYDYFKHLGTIALVALGAILTSTQGKSAASGHLIMVAIALVSISAILGFSAMNQIIDHRKSGKRLRPLFNWEQSIATALFATGLGLFMSEVGNALG